MNFVRVTDTVFSLSALGGLGLTPCEGRFDSPLKYYILTITETEMLTFEISGLFLPWKNVNFSF
jgi:hypothetical protein